MIVPNRRQCRTVSIGPFAATVSFLPHPDNPQLCGPPCEVFITDRGKSGSQLDEDLYELGVMVSKLMQGEDQ